MSDDNYVSRADRATAGKSLRSSVPRASHRDWTPPADRRDPVDVLIDSNVGRLPELIPIRYGRMLVSPFTFFRGAAAVMAADLSKTPATGLRVQACGDCHLLNFGVFATPERNLVFDINDFDETLPAPWEWDIKRLAASFVLAGRDNRFDADDSRDSAVAVVRAYRERLAELAEMKVLDVWYSKMDAMKWIEQTVDPELRALREKRVKIAQNAPRSTTSTPSWSSMLETGRASRTTRRTSITCPNRLKASFSRWSSKRFRIIGNHCLMIVECFTRDTDLSTWP